MQRGPRLPTVATVLILCLCGLIATKARGSQSDEQRARIFAETHEPEIVQRLAQQLEIDTQPAAVLAHARRAMPNITSAEAHERHSQSLRIMAGALEAVLSGADPERVFAESGYRDAGVDPRAWSFYVQHLASPTFVENLRQQAEADHEHYLASLTNGLRSLFIETEISRRLCELPALAARIEGHFAALYPAGLTAPEPLPGERAERCRQEARIWFLDYARDAVGDLAPKLVGWEHHLALLQVWDEHAIALRPGRN